MSVLLIASLVPALPTIVPPNGSAAQFVGLNRKPGRLTAMLSDLTRSGMPPTIWGSVAPMEMCASVDDTEIPARTTTVPRL